MRRRVVAAMTTMVVLAVLVFGLPLGVALDRRQVDQDRREITRLAALAASRAETTRLGTSLLPHRPERDQRVGLYDRAGRRIDGTGPARLEPEARPALRDRVVETRAGGVLLTAVPVVDEHGEHAVVRASEPLSSGRARRRAVWLRLAALGLLVDGMAFLGAVALARRITRPLAELVGSATRIGDGDFTASPRRTGLPEVDQVASALTATAGRLSELIAREQAFSADASHQLRSPLAALRVTVESELVHPRDDPAEALTETLVEVERLERTIDEFLVLARETSLQREPIDLGRTLDQLVRRWESALASDHRRLVSERASAIPPARVSAAAVSHVLDVLVSNAQLHGEGDVVVAARAHHGAVSVTVTDDGPGIGHPEGLFVRRQAEARGNGIGLA
ncbi:MAG: two-component sensor histidine kinase, partial [Actinomycetia bacterium]|nr:two-component sensor histidine kinase [Actinomycetes bacterium]